MPITKQTIAIIGAGSAMGVAISKYLAPGNYRLLLFDRKAEKISALADHSRE